MSIRENIYNDWLVAFKSGDTDKKLVLTGIRAAIKNEDIAKKTEISDEEILKVIQKEAKKRQDSIEEYTKADRTDRAELERAELELIKVYLPVQLTLEEVREIVKKVITEQSVTSIKEIGKVMKIVMPLIAGKSDGKVVNEAIKLELN